MRNELAHAILTETEDHLTCDACQAAFAECISLEPMEITTSPVFNAVQQHVQICPACARAYAELRALLTLAYSADLPQVATAPHFDYAFLGVDAEAAANQPYWWDRLGNLIVQFSTDLLASLPSPAVAPAYAGVKSAQPGKLLHQFVVDQRERDLMATIAVHEKPGAPDLCMIEVEVQIPSRGAWLHQAETEVTLRQGDRVMAIKETNDFGLVLFADVDTKRLAELSFEITPSAD